MANKSGVTDSGIDIIAQMMGEEMPGSEILEESEQVQSTDPFEQFITDVGNVPSCLTIVVYGKNGCGKTTFGASGDERTLILEVEKDGTFSVVKKNSKAKKVRIRTWKDFEDAYWYLTRNPGKYTTVVIDTLTRLSELALRSIVLNNKAPKAELMDRDIVKVTLAQRGEISQRMVFWLAAYAELPCHKIWLCQEGYGSEDKDVADVQVYPDLQRKTRVYVCSDATLIAHMEVQFNSSIDAKGNMIETPTYLLSARPSSNCLTKDRSSVLTKPISNPQLPDIINMIYK